MASAIIERMRLIVKIDERISKVQEGLVALEESFGTTIEDPSGPLNLEEFNTGLDAIVETTARLLEMVPIPNGETDDAKADTPRRRGGGKRGQKYSLDGEWLTFKEIHERFPHLNENTLRTRLNPNSGYSVHEAVHGRARGHAPAEDVQGDSAAA